MMHTRCPACRTTFRIRPEQLRLRQGRVRCGHCGNPFNALESLLEDAPAEALLPTDAPAAAEPVPGEVPAAPPDTGDATGSDSGPLFVLEETAPPAPEQLALPGGDEEVPELYVEGLSRRPEEAAALDFSGIPPDSDLETRPGPAEPEEDTDEFATDSEAPGFGLDFEIPELPSRVHLPPPEARPPDPPISPGLHFTLEELEAPEPVSTPPPEPEPPESSPAAPLPLRPSADRSEEPAPAQPRADEKPIEPGLEFPAAWNGLPELDSPPDDDQAALHPLTGAQRTTSNPALWGLGIGTLATLLLAQSVLLFRNGLVQIVPESQPGFAALCAKLGCEMAPPREAGYIAIESSDLRPQDGPPGQFELRATIRNRAPFVQAYPYLELTLTDASDRAIARRVLEPREWRPANEPEEGFTAGQRIEVTVPFAVSELKPVGYRVYAFYP